MDRKAPEFVKYLEEEGKPLSTQAQYQGVMSQYWDYIEEKQIPFSISSISSFIDSLDSFSTRARALSVLKSYLKFLKSPIFFEIEKLELIK